MSRYFQRRSVAVYMPLDEDALPEDFVIEGPDHPRVLLRVPTAGDGLDAREVGQELPEPLRPVVMVSMVVTGIAGDWSLYAGQMRAPSWDLPDLTDAESARRRARSVLSLDDPDVLDLIDRVRKLSSVKEKEAGN